mmetsp:Transcript_117881/g.229198  ORF Transcript_117881/g.229198 Transcript_117881/m.229198 type:complete len:282 (+) Transcript_117881:1161-2006(+)
MHPVAFLLSRRSMLLTSPVVVASFGSNMADATPSDTTKLYASAPTANNLSDISCAGRRFNLKGLQPVGRGAHGTVVVEPGGTILLKVSYANTASKVETECSTFQYLEAKEVPHVERCLAACRLEDGRSVALLTPYFTGSSQITSALVSSLAPSAKVVLARASAQFLVRSLMAGIAVSDLQALVRPDGSLLFIDFTEAGPIDDKFGAARAAQSLAEWSTTLPPSEHGATVDAVADELDRLAPSTLPEPAAAALASLASLPGAADSQAARLEAAVMRVAVVIR